MKQICFTVVESKWFRKPDKAVKLRSRFNEESKVKAYQAALYRYQAGIFREWDSPALIIGGAEDHVHALFSLSRNHPLKKIVEEVKKGSSKWMKSEGPRITEFSWQAGYAAFSVSQSSVADVIRYIETQEDHHRQVSFQDELRKLLLRHEIEFNERYVWD